MIQIVFGTLGIVRKFLKRGNDGDATCITFSNTSEIFEKLLPQLF